MSRTLAFVLLSLTSVAEHHKVEAQTPTVIKLENWTFYAHGSHGGQATILDKNRIQIESFNYDGRGPEAWFQIGLVKMGRDNIPHPCANHRRHPIIPDDNGQCSTKPVKYADAKLILTIPNDYTWDDIDYVGLYCYKYQHLFGFVKIPYFDISKLQAGKTKVPGCSKIHGKILADSTSPVTCVISQACNTSTGMFC